MKKLLAAILCLGLLASCSGSPSAQSASSGSSGPATSAPASSSSTSAGGIDYTQGDSHKFVAATGVVMNNPIQLAISEMNRVLTEKTNGRLTFDEYHNSALGSERDLLEQESTGMIDCVGGGSQVAYNFVQTCGLFDLPYLFLSDEHAKAVLGSDIGDGILKEFDGTGIKALSWVACGWRNVTANKQLSGPADMAGVKIRVLENQVYMDMFSEIGASPTPMAFTEVYTALQQGTVDAEDNPLIVINSAKFDEVQKYIYLTEHTFAAGLITFSQDVFDSLPDTDQALIQSVASQMLDYSFQASDKVKGDSLAEISSRGNAEVVEVDKTVWSEAMSGVYPKYEDTYGADLIDSILNFKY